MIVHFVNAWWFGMIGFGIGYLMSLERPALHRSPARLMLAIFFWPFTLLIPRPRPKFMLKCTADDIADPYDDRLRAIWCDSALADGCQVALDVPPDVWKQPIFAIVAFARSKGWIATPDDGSDLEGRWFYGCPACEKAWAATKHPPEAMVRTAWPANQPEVTHGR